MSMSETDSTAPGAEDGEAASADAPKRPAPRAQSVAASATPGGRPWLAALAAVVTVASLLGPISASGIWDPFELRIADLARRIALNLLGAQDLLIDGATNSVPSLGELARGQLPFTSVAVG